MIVLPTSVRAALAALKVDRWLWRVPTPALFGVYAANLALPVVMAAAAGLWPASLLATVPIAFAAIFSRVRTWGVA